MAEKIGDRTPGLLVLDQFHLQRSATGDRGVYCFRPSCEGCRFDPVCLREETTLEIGEGLNIRRAFTARPGFKIVAIDYKQIEIRVAAMLSQEKFWIDAFLHNRDLHEEMARVSYKIPDGELVPKHLRDAAKAVNFAAIYLATPQTISAGSALDLDEASRLLDIWWKTVSNYKIWCDNQYIKAEEMWRKNKYSYVTTYFGRRRDVSNFFATLDKIKDRQSKEYRKIASQAKRICVNSPVQGTSADIMKAGIVELTDWVKAEGLQDDVHPLLTVHDEMVFEIREDKGLDRFEELCLEASRRLTLSTTDLLKNWNVAVETDIEVGDNWAKVGDFQKYLKTKRGDSSLPPTDTAIQHTIEAREDVVESIRSVEEVDRVIWVRFNPLIEGTDPLLRPNEDVFSVAEALKNALFRMGLPEKQVPKTLQPITLKPDERLCRVIFAGHLYDNSPYKMQLPWLMYPSEFEYFSNNFLAFKTIAEYAVVPEKDLEPYNEPRKPRRSRARTP